MVDFAVVESVFDLQRVVESLQTVVQILRGRDAELIGHGKGRCRKVSDRRQQVEQFIAVRIVLFGFEAVSVWKNKPL